jgi:hypothetical protein
MPMVADPRFGLQDLLALGNEQRGQHDPRNDITFNQPTQSLELRSDSP